MLPKPWPWSPNPGRYGWQRLAHQLRQSGNRNDLRDVAMLAYAQKSDFDQLAVSLGGAAPLEIKPAVPDEKPPIE